MGLCSFEGCVRGQHCKGLCKPHYEQSRRGCPLRPLLETLARACRIEGCDRDLWAVRDGLCHLHYTRRRRGWAGHDYSENPASRIERECEWCSNIFTPKQRSNSQCCGPSCTTKNAGLYARYGLRGADVRKMLAAQQGVCANSGCHRAIRFDVGNRADALNIDHDHSCCPGTKSCGKCVRWLLCHGCNVALGFCEDSSDRLRGLAALLDSRQ